MQVETVPIDSVEPHPGNPRVHSEGKLRESLEAHGQFKPIVVNSRNGQIIAGHGIHSMMRELGHQTIDVVWMDLTETDHKRVLLMDNRSSEFAHDEYAGVKMLLQSIADDDVALLLGTGYDEATLTGMDEPPVDLAAQDLTMEAHIVIVQCTDEFDAQDVYERVTAEWGYSAKKTTKRVKVA